MPEASSTYSFKMLFATLLFSFCIVSEAEVICRSNDCNGCCVTSDFCSTEHTFINETRECQRRSPRPSPITPLVSGLEKCPFDLYTHDYGPCPNSYVNDLSKSVGEYGKPNWVGAEFHSVSHESFSMIVKWQHIDIQLSDLNLTAVKGYEVRIYKSKKSRKESLLHCFCVIDPSMRNITDIRSNSFIYEDELNMIVEVRTYPSLIGRDENNRRRNCSLLTGCATTNEIEYCSFSRDCYSWPQNCLNFFDPLTCAPQLYNPPVIIKAEMNLVDDHVTDGDAWKIDLSWEPPMMNYDLFPIPRIYYVTIESNYSTLNFKVNTTNISILSLKYTMYTAIIAAYVPCSGLSQPLEILHDVGNIGCGYPANTTVTIIPSSPPLSTSVPSSTSVLITAAGPTGRSSEIPINPIIIATAAAVVVLSACIMLLALVIFQRKYAHKSIYFLSHRPNPGKMHYSMCNIKN